MVSLLIGLLTLCPVARVQAHRRTYPGTTVGTADLPAGRQVTLYTVEGRLTLSDGRPLPARVTLEAPPRALPLEGQTPRTGYYDPVSGHYQIDSLEPGAYRIHIPARGGVAPLYRQITLPPRRGGQVLHLDLALSPLPDDPHTRPRPDRPTPGHQDTLAGAVLAEVDVTQGRPARPGSTHTHTLDEAHLTAAAGRPLAEALAGLPGVALQQTGPTVVRPVIRGLSGHRVLILNNGLRHEGQQWGGDHAPELDPMALGELTLVTGVGAVRYGPDAMGGVILGLPPRLPDTAGVSGQVTLAGRYNNGQGAATGSLTWVPAALPRLALRVQGTLRRAGDARAPRYRLTGTALAEEATSVHTRYHGATFDLEASYSWFATRLGILESAHTGSLADLNRVLTTDRPTIIRPFSYEIRAPRQRVSHEVALVRGRWHVSPSWDLEATLGRQFNFREEYDNHRQFGIADRSRPALAFGLLTESVELVADHRPLWAPPGTRLTTGAQYYRGSKTGNFDGTSPRFLLRSIIPNYTSDLAGSFATVQAPAGAYTVEVGGRLDVKQYQMAPGSWPDASLSSTPTFVAPSAMAGVSRPLADGHLILEGQVSYAVRPPSVAEMYSRGLHHGLAAIEIGNPRLAAERLTLGSLGARLRGHRLWGSISAWGGRYDGYINLVPRPPAAQGIAGTFVVFEYIPQNLWYAGAEGQLTYEVTRAVSLSASTTGIRARLRRPDSTGNRYPTQFPADRLRLSGRYEGVSHSRRPFVQLGVMAIDRQHRLPDRLLEEGYDFAPAPPAYALVDLAAGARLPLRGLPEPLDIALTVTNLFDQTYRDYLDRQRYFADGLGRDISLRLTARF